MNLPQLKNFVRREWTYLFFLLALCGIYFFLRSGRPHWQQNPVSAPYQAFLKTEEKFKARLQSSEGLGDLFAKRPALALGVSVYSVFFAVLFVAGCVIDGLLIASARFRQRVLQKKTGPPVRWGAGSILHVAVQFLAFSLLLNLSLDYLLHATNLLDERSATLWHTVIMDALAAALIVREIRRRGGSWKDIGFDLRGRTPRAEALFGAAGYAAVIPLFAAVLALLMALIQWLAYEPDPHPLVDIFLNQDRRGQWLIYSSIFLACVAGPFFEEIFFRGFCYPALKKNLGAGGGAVLSAVFFALIHLNEFAFLPIFILGLGLAYLYEKRGCLIAPVTLHILHNSLFISYFFLAKAVMTAAGGEGP